MPINCPKCQEPIEAVTQATFDERVSKQAKANKELAAQLKAAEAELEAGRAAISELAETRKAAERAAAWAGYDHVPEARRTALERYYAVDQDGAETPQTLAEWLAAKAEAKEFTDLAPPAAKTAAAPPPKKPGAASAPDPKLADPLSPKKLTPAEYAKATMSPEFAALSKEDRAKKRAELRGLLGAS